MGKNVGSMFRGRYRLSSRYSRRPCVLDLLALAFPRRLYMLNVIYVCFPRKKNVQVREASVGNPVDFTYLDWHSTPDLAEYITQPDGKGQFTVDTYCEEALLNRRGSLQLSR